MFIPLSITIQIPKVFVSEFLKRLPDPIPVCCSVYSFIEEIEGSSTDIDSNLENSINFKFTYAEDKQVNVTADIYDSSVCKIYKKFLGSIGYIDRQKVKALYDTREIHY